MDDFFEPDERGIASAGAKENSVESETGSEIRSNPASSSFPDEWIKRICELPVKKLEDPLLNVIHLYAPALFDKVNKNFKLVTKAPHKFNFRRDLPMTAFVRNGSQGELIFGLQQKFHAKVSKNTFVHFQPDMHYDWGGKDDLVTITVRIGNPDPAQVKTQILRLIQEASGFILLYGA